MLNIPSDRKQLVVWAQNLIEACRASSGDRASLYRLLATLVETGTDDPAVRSRMNLMYHHLRRTESHLFSPIQMQFAIDFEREYPREIYERGQAVGRVLTRNWALNDTDRAFAQGVFEALKYGACILKQWVEESGPKRTPRYRRKLIMPWQFGVYREDENDLDLQDAMCETTYLSMPQIWQRIAHLPDASNLFKRIQSHAQRGTAPDDPSSFLGNILSTNTINTSGNTIAGAGSPGGVAIFGAPSAPTPGASVDIDLVKFHEIWVKGPEDYVTIQIIDPDVLIMPYFSGDIMTRKTNALIPGKINSGIHPYTLIQPNETSGNFWGRSEIIDLIEPQVMITQTTNDARRLFGLQVDKYLAFTGVDGDIDEVYDSMRSAGYSNLGQNGQVNDLTPKFPPETLPYIKSLIDSFNIIGGFPSVMQGEGDAGVRAGSHADTLLKTGSPRLRSMSLAVERNCAKAGSLTLDLAEAKDGSNYWTNGKTMESIKDTEFILSDLPDDRHVIVDSHSTSPIFMDDHEQLVAFGAKLGWIGAEEGIDMMPLPNKELLKAKYAERQEAAAKEKQEMMQRYPDLGEKVALKSITGRK
jgi:hypothetical protein